MYRDSRTDGLLTQREREVVALLAAGMSGVDIGDKLDLSPATVRAHLRNAMRRANAQTRVQLVVEAVARGEVELNGPTVARTD